MNKTFTMFEKVSGGIAGLGFGRIRGYDTNYLLTYTAFCIIDPVRHSNFDSLKG
jgi:hypothetical protein